MCFQLPNWWEAVAFCWAVWRCGAIASPITPALRGHEVGFILRQTGARHIAVPARLPWHRLRAAWCARPASTATSSCSGDRGRKRSDGADTPPVPAVDVDDIALILWTSGTTSEPKGVVHTHQSLRVEADTIAAAHAMAAGESLLLPMPITHVAGLTYGVLLPITSAITTVLMDTWEPGRALELVEREHIAVMISTPVFMRTMIDHPSFASSRPQLAAHVLARRRRRRARDGARGRARIRLLVQAHVRLDRVPDAHDRAAGDDPERDATTDGPLIGAAELRIVDPTTLADLPPGTPGELLARGPEMFVGLSRRGARRAGIRRRRLVPHRRPRGLRRRVPDDRRPAEGHHHPRRREHLGPGGRGRCSSPIPTIAEAACVAMPDAVMGEKVCAFVIASPGHAPVLEAVRAHLVERGLARFKLPERLEIREALPRTASGKVQKSPLARGVARMDEFRQWVRAELQARLAPRAAGSFTTVLGGGLRRPRNGPRVSAGARRFGPGRARLAARVRRARGDTRTSRRGARRAGRVRRARSLSVPRRPRAGRPHARRPRPPRPVRALAAEDRDRRGDLVPAVLRARRGIRSRRPLDRRTASAIDGRRVDGERAEGVDEPGCVRAVRALARPPRQLGSQAPRHHRVRARPARCTGSTSDRCAR